MKYETYRSVLLFVFYVCFMFCCCFLKLFYVFYFLVFDWFYFFFFVLLVLCFIDSNSILRFSYMSSRVVLLINVWSFKLRLHTPPYQYCNERIALRTVNGNELEDKEALCNAKSLTICVWGGNSKHKPLQLKSTLKPVFKTLARKVYTHGLITCTYPLCLRSSHSSSHFVILHTYTLRSHTLIRWVVAAISIALFCVR